MKFNPTRAHRQFLCFIVISILLILSCSKDSDLLSETILNGEIQSVEDRESQKEAESEDTVVEVVEIEETTEISEEVLQEEVALASRTTSFLPIQDAYMQNGDGINNTFIRLQENKRVSYLLYDLSAIDSISGTITNAHFEFTVYKDPGHGKIKIQKGSVTKWTEQDIDAETAPEPGIELGTIDKVYAIGKTEIVELETSEIAPEITTLVLSQVTGNDLAIASKENTTEEAPKLVITYNTALDAPAIEDFFPVKEASTEDEITNEEEEVSNTEGSDNEVVNESPIAKISAKPVEGEAPLEVVFKASGSSDDVAIEVYSWDFMDGTTSRKKNPTHTFEEAGSYEVELVVADEEGLTDIETITITVKEPENKAPKAVVSATPSSGSAPLEVQFKGSNSTDDNEVKSYKWNFKDGTTSTSKNPSHTFADPGSYKVELTVTDEEGLSHSKTVTINVSEPPKNEPPRAIATATPKSGDAPLEVQFKGSNSTDDEEVTSYHWNFRDGSSSNDSNPTHTFNEPGSYSVKLTVKDEEGLEHSNSITITVNEPAAVTPSTNADVRYWQNRFDSKWSEERSHAYSLARSKNRNQEYYYLAYYIDGLSAIWQATGNNSYLDTALDLINETVDDAQSVGGGYSGWRASDGNEYGLWDTFYWRHVATILRIINQTPQLKSSSKYKNQYNKLLAFSEKNIWDRYASKEPVNLTHIYRSTTHKASHWARIAMELYIITKKSKYKKVFDNMSFGKMPRLSSNFKNQFFPNPKDNSAYAWDDEWGVKKGNIQDTAHGGPFVSFIALAYSNNMYWRKSDINALIRTLNVVYPNGADRSFFNVDGSGGTGAYGRLHEWFYLARYSQSLQNRIRNGYNDRHFLYYGSQGLGIAALNAKILADGRAAYGN